MARKTLFLKVSDAVAGNGAKGFLYWLNSQRFQGHPSETPILLRRLLSLSVDAIGYFPVLLRHYRTIPRGQSLRRCYPHPLPVLAKVIQKLIPVPQLVALEIRVRERESVVNAHDAGF